MGSESDEEQVNGVAPAEEQKPPSLSIVDVKVATELVPEWSNLVVKVGQELGDEVLIGQMPDGLVVRIKLHPSRKEGLVDALSRRWESFSQEQAAREDDDPALSNGSD